MTKSSTFSTGRRKQNGPLPHHLQLLAHPIRPIRSSDRSTASTAGSGGPGPLGPRGRGARRRLGRSSPGPCAGTQEWTGSGEGVDPVSGGSTVFWQVCLIGSRNTLDIHESCCLGLSCFIAKGCLEAGNEYSTTEYMGLVNRPWLEWKADNYIAYIGRPDQTCPTSPFVFLINFMS